MKKLFAALFCSTLVGLAAHTVHASVVLSNLDPNNGAFGFNAPVIGQALLTGNQPISLTSVQFVQTGGMAAGENFSVFSRNADGTVGTSLFSSFTLSFDSMTDITLANVDGSFNLEANSGYFFVLNSGSMNNIEWSFTNSTDYAAAFGASLPSDDDSFSTAGNNTVYYTLSEGPQLFQVNGMAGAAVPEPSTLAFLTLSLLGGVVLIDRRRRAQG